MELREEKNWKYYVSNILRYAVLILASLIIIAPMLVVLLGAFKTNEELLTTGPLTLPENWLNFDNFIKAWTKGRMATGFINTAIMLNPTF